VRAGRTKSLQTAQKAATHVLRDRVETDGVVTFTVRIKMSLRDTNLRLCA